MRPNLEKGCVDKRQNVSKSSRGFSIERNAARTVESESYHPTPRWLSDSHVPKRKAAGDKKAGSGASNSRRSGPRIRLRIYSKRGGQKEKERCGCST